MKVNKENWKEDHLARKHNINLPWCPLCVARKEGEDNPLQHLVPPQQDPSQEGLEYLKPNYRPEVSYANVIESGEVEM